MRSNFREDSTSSSRRIISPLTAFMLMAMSAATFACLLAAGSSGMMMGIQFASASTSGGGSSAAAQQEQQKQQIKINLDGGLMELVTRLAEVLRNFLATYAPLPHCMRSTSEFLRRVDGARVKKLENSVLKATAAVTEWRAALDHPRPALYANLTEPLWKDLVKMQTEDADKQLEVAQNALVSYNTRTAVQAAPSMYAACYAEAFATATSYDGSALKALVSSFAAASSDDDLITDEDDGPSAVPATGIASSSSSLPKNFTLSPAEHSAVLAAPWPTRFQIYAELHVSVALATGAAVAMDAIDYAFAPSWSALREFYEGFCYKHYVDWWHQGQRRVFVTRRLLSGQSTQTSFNTVKGGGKSDSAAAAPSMRPEDDDEDEEDIGAAVGAGGAAPATLEEVVNPIPTRGEGIHFGPRPGAEPKQLDEKYGKISYTGKEAADKRRAMRKAMNMTEGFPWLDLTEALHVTPESASFSAFVLGSEAILCFCIAISLYIGGMLTMVATLGLFQLALPIIIAYHVMYRFVFGIFFKSFFWSFFVNAAAFAEMMSSGSASAAPLPLTLKTLIAAAPTKLPAAIKSAIAYDFGASALPILIILGLVTVFAVTAVAPLVFVALEFIGGNANVKRSPQALQAQRAREILAMREQRRLERLEQQSHGHSHGGVACNHSH